MNVNCPGCKQSYKLDEGRIPDRGQKMRCPKCATSFRVHKGGTTTDIVAGPDVKPQTPDRPSVLPKRPDRPSRIPKPDPSGVPSMPPVLGSGDVDLPAPKGAYDPFGDIDLPTPAFPGGADLPAPRGADDPFGDIDLPVPSSGGADLPAPKSSAQQGDFGSFPLPGDIPAPNPENPFGEIDLPTPFGAVDLPTPSGSVDLPTPSGSVDLPTPSVSVDLPTPSGSVDLPTPSGVTDVPAPFEDPFGEIDIGIGSGSRKSPRPGAGGTPPAPPHPLPSPGDLGPPPAGMAPPASPATTLDEQSRQRVQSSGSTDYGEIDLTGEGAAEERSLSGEFDAFPTGGDKKRDDNLGGIDLAESSMEGRTKGTFIDDVPEGQEKDQQRPSGVKYEGRRKLERQSRKLKIALLAILALIGAGGAALSFTSLGPFGVNALASLLPSGPSEELMGQLVDKSNKRIQADTFADLNEAIKELDLIRKDHDQDDNVNLMGVFLHNWHQIRFGADKAHHAAATKLLGTIDLEESGSRFASLAGATSDLLGLRIPKVIKEHGNKPDLSPNFLAILGEAHLLAGNYDDALTTAINLSKKEKSARAAFLKTRAMVRTNKREEAVTGLEELVNANPKHTDAKLLLAMLLVDIKGTDTARIGALLDPVCALGKDTSTDIQRARAHALLARLHLNANNYAKATGELDLAEELNPNDKVLLVGRGTMALFSGDLVTASSFFMRARTDDPTDVHALLGQADTMIRQGALADAKTLLSEIEPDNNKNPLVHFLLGKVEFALKNNDSAEKSLARSIGLDKEFIEPYITLSDLYLKTGRDSLAMRTLDEASEAVPGSPLIKLSIADGHAARGDFTSAIVALDEALRLDPDNVRAHFKMAQMYRKLGSLSDAERALEEVSSRNPNYPGLSLEQGLLLEHSGKVEDALAAYERVLAANPEDLGAKTRVGAASMLSGKLDRAKKLLGEVLGANNKSAEANYYLGEVFRMEMQPTEAALYLRVAVDLEDSNPLYHLRYAMVLMQLRDMVNATVELNRAKELDPKMAEIYVRIGEVKLRTGSARDAISVLDKALGLDPKMADAYGLIGEAFEELADLRSSTAYYQRAISQIPDDAKMHFRLALNQLQMGSERSSTASFSRAVELGEKMREKPQWLPEAYFRLGVAQMNMSQKAAAIASFKRYLEIAPESALDRSEVIAHLDLLQN